MIRSVKNLIGFKIGATDGAIGKVKEFYFDDTTWTIRYLIVETGSLFFKRNVILSTQSLLPTDWEKRLFLTNLTTDQIKNSPAIDTEGSVSRQQETDLNKHYSWTDYWSTEFAANDVNVASHLLSSEKIKEYHVKANDMELGKVEDLLTDETTWKINFMVLDAFDHPPAKTVLVSPSLIKEINRSRATIILNPSAEEIKKQPEYFPDKVIAETYQE